MIVTTILLIYFSISFILMLDFMDDNDKEELVEKCEELNLSLQLGYVVIFLSLPLISIHCKIFKK